MSLMPGWPVTTFPPYFEAGALYSGCAAIITLFIILRYFFRFELYMTIPILEKTCKLTFAIAMAWTYLNMVEFASVWYGHDMASKEVLWDKFTGPIAPLFWDLMIFGSVLTFALGFEKLRLHLLTMFVVSLLLNVSMWLERWMIVSPTLSLSYQPFTWKVVWPSMTQWAVVFGSFGWFGLLFLVVSMYEVKELVYHRRRANVESQAHAFHLRASDPQPVTDSPSS